MLSQVETAFRMFDTDQDGYLSWEEFQQVYNKLNTNWKVKDLFLKMKKKYLSWEQVCIQSNIKSKYLNLFQQTKYFAKCINYFLWTDGKEHGNEPRAGTEDISRMWSGDQVQTKSKPSPNQVQTNKISQTKLTKKLSNKTQPKIRKGEGLKVIFFSKLSWKSLWNISHFSLLWIFDKQPSNHHLQIHKITALVSDWKG